MRKSFATEAINLRNYPLNEDDSIVVMFSKTRGLIRAVARGSKRPKSKLGARIQMFIANKLMLFEGKNLDTISEAQSLKTFSKIRYDLDKLNASMYVAELVNNFCSKFYNSDENSKEIYDLIYKALDNIANANSKCEVLLYLIKFSLKFMNILGWGLDFYYCSKCQNELDCSEFKSTIFSYSLGGFLCENCASSHIGQSVRVHNKIKMFLSVLSDTSYEEKTRYDDMVNEQVLEKCFGFLRKYIEKLTDKRIKVFDKV